MDAQLNDPYYNSGSTVLSTDDRSAALLPTVGGSVSDLTKSAAKQLGPPVTFATWIGAIANVANAAVGAGVLSFPYAFSKCGIMEALALSALFGVVMGFTLHVLGVGTHRTSADSYQALALALLGRRWSFVTQVCMMMYSFGALVGYLDVLVDQTTPVLQLWVAADSWLLNRNYILFMGLPILVPLALVPKIEYLGFTSSLAILSVVYLEFSVLYEYGGSFVSAASWDNVSWFKGGVGVFEALPILCFALQCHLVFVTVGRGVLSHRGGSMKMLDWVGAICMVLCLSLYVPTGIAGYLHFRDNTPSDIVTGMAERSVVAIVARFAIASTAMFSYPLLCFVGREVLHDMVFEQQSVEARLQQPPPTSRCGALWQMRNSLGSTSRRLLLTGTLIGLSVLTAALVPKISAVLEITGSTAAVMQVFIIPGMMMLRIYRRSAKHRVLAFAVMIGGGTVGVMGTVVAVLKMAHVDIDG